jgi:hypothetical protein
MIGTSSVSAWICVSSTAAPPALPLRLLLLLRARPLLLGRFALVVLIVALLLALDY